MLGTVCGMTPKSQIDTQVSALRDRAAGPVLCPDDGGYDTGRAGFQVAVRHRPDVLVGATGERDVRAAVEFAGVRGLPVAVQATGHGLTVSATQGVLIDTRRMTGVRVDPVARTAHIAAGTRWRQVIEAAAPHGLAPLSGSFPDLGAVAYTLGGGTGLLGRTYGYTADHVRGLDVVTADARSRHVTAGHDPDLFWALRGAGTDFGVVTGMEVGLVPVRRVYGGELVFDTDRVEDLLHAYREWTATVPEEMNSSVTLIGLPDVPGVPEALRGRYTARVCLAYTGPVAEGERLVAPLRAVGSRLTDTLRDMPYTDSGSIHNEPDEPHAYLGDNALLRDFDSATMRAVLDRAGPDAPMMCVVGLRHLGGALAREPGVPSAVGHRDAPYQLGVLSPVADGATETVRSVHRGLFAQVAPQTIGRSVNFVFGTGDRSDRAGYDAAGHRRLADLKQAWDPKNLFRHNHHHIGTD